MELVQTSRKRNDLMNVLFIYRYYGKELSNSVVDFQRISLINQGIEVDNFYVKKGGIKNYVNQIFKLKKYLKQNEYDLIHAHYSFCGFIAGLAAKKPVICSLMGSDILQLGKFHLFIVKLFSKYIWKATLVKTQQMQSKLYSSIKIPNGIDFSNFREIQKNTAIKYTEYSIKVCHILFIAQSPDSKVKNIELSRQAIHKINGYNIEFHVLSGKKFEELPYYYNVADLVLLTSFSEGSSNVIKEAMACNCPIVSTDVGDVRELIGNTEGCYICSFDSNDVAEKIKMALGFTRTKGRTNGRQRIIELGLDSETVAKKIIEVYQKVLKEISEN
jgi:teichuronic acid biosynthesis glycosyltransferase TuaC